MSAVAGALGRVEALDVARWSSYAWGALHVLGGGLIIATAAADGGGAALEDLGSGAAAGSLPADPGPVVEGLLGFHGLNIAVFGLAVLVLVRRRSTAALRDALFVMAAADIGLVVFLLAPGYLPLGEGIWGPALLLAAAAAFVLARREQRTPDRPTG